MSIKHEIKSKQAHVYKELTDMFKAEGKKKKNKSRKRRGRPKDKKEKAITEKVTKELTTRDIEELMGNRSYRRGKGGSIKQVR